MWFSTSPDFCTLFTRTSYSGYLTPSSSQGGPTSEKCLKRRLFPGHGCQCNAFWLELLDLSSALSCSLYHGELINAVLLTTTVYLFHIWQRSNPSKRFKLFSFLNQRKPTATSVLELCGDAIGNDIAPVRSVHNMDMSDLSFDGNGIYLPVSRSDWPKRQLGAERDHRFTRQRIKHSPQVSTSWRTERIHCEDGQNLPKWNIIYLQCHHW